MFMNADRGLSYAPSHLDVKGLLIIPHTCRYYFMFSATSILPLYAWLLRNGVQTRYILKSNYYSKYISYFNWLYLITFVHYYLVFPEFYWAVEKALQLNKRTALQNHPLRETGAVLKVVYFPFRPLEKLLQFILN